MNIDYRVGNIFELGNLVDNPKDYVLAHCIAADFGMGGGIAKQFVDKMDMRNKLWEWAYSTRRKVCGNPYGHWGNACVEIVGTAVQIGDVFNLVTKTWTYEKPKYEDLVKCLEDMKLQMFRHRHQYLAIPKLGCGIDGLNWEVVQVIIEGVFRETNVNVLVVTLQ